MNFRRAFALAATSGAAITGTVLGATSASATSQVGCPTNGVNILYYQDWQGDRACYANAGTVYPHLENAVEAWSAWNSFEVWWTTPGGSGNSGPIVPGQTFSGFPDQATITKIQIFS